MKLRPCFRHAGFFGLFQFVLFALPPAYAGSATWNLNPIGGNWNFASNWTPATIPNSPTDIATFSVSNVTDITAFDEVEVNTVTFVAGASAFSINTGIHVFNLSGEGVVNDSGVVQNFVVPPFDEAGSFSNLWFTNNASAGSLTNYLVAGTDQELFSGGFLVFKNDSTASFAAITVAGDGPSGNGSPGDLQFLDASTADHATIVNAGGTRGGGQTEFEHGSTAGESTITNEPGSSANFGSGGMVVFSQGTTSGGDSVITNNGATVPGAPGGSTEFLADPDMGNAIVVANGGSNGGLGGSIVLADTSTGAGGTILVYGNGSLDISAHEAPGITIGAMNGDGLVFLGANTLTIGSNDARSVFAGVIQDVGLSQDSGGGVTKIGSNILTLSGVNLYTGKTTVLEGTLSVNNTQGSGTGTGPVLVHGGILAGDGIIAGSVTIGGNNQMPAFLAPGRTHQAPLTIQGSLGFQVSSTYVCSYRGNRRRVEFDQVVANGVTIGNGAGFNFPGVTIGRLNSGTILTIISNTSASPIAGTFSNLPDGAIIAANGGNFQASYEGGDGNDLTLTVVP